jgi:hypothetical protein
MEAFMSVKTFYNEEEDIIETILTESINNKDVLRFIDDMIQLTLKCNCFSWIVDYTNARYKLSTMQIFDLPAEVFKKMDLLEDKKYRIKRAIIRINDNADFAFLENVANNRGQNLSVFSDRNAAIKWLKGNKG